ncbi:hypothetical protein DSECCO2_512090 [anaerobic digester metagenome]
MTDSLSVGSKLSVGSSLVVQDSLTVGTKMVVNQTLSVADSMSVGKSLSVRDSVVVGSNIRVEKNLYVADTLSVGGILQATEIAGVNTISANSIGVATLSGVNGEVTLEDPSDNPNPDPSCDALVLNYCSRQIHGYKKLTDGSIQYPGVAIGKTSVATGLHSVAAGFNCFSAGLGSLAMGNNVRAFAENSIIIGSAATGFFTTTVPNSLMIGFNAPNNKPSLFVGPSVLSGLPGNVGIGTSTPADKLVIGEGYEQISFGSAMNDMNNGNGWWVGYMGMNATRTRTSTWQSSVWTISGDAAAGFGGGIIATDAGGKMFIIPISTGVNTTVSLTDADIYARRVVEIGAIDPNADPSGGLMRVNGKIYCKEIEVKIDPAFWWDDVFAPGYKLRTFEELQAYIALNGHLPDVPSETEVSENGLSLGEGYGTLLRKIEELTLYMLELKKENEELRKMIENSSN